jgi:hypothetical protein
LKEKFKMKDRKERERIYPRPLLNVWVEYKKKVNPSKCLVFLSLCMQINDPMHLFSMYVWEGERATVSLLKHMWQMTIQIGGIFQALTLE